MWRIALLLAWLISATLCLTFTVTAQDNRSAGSQTPSATRQSAATARAPELLELAQARPGTLVDQLKMLRRRPDHEPRSSSRRAAPRERASRAAPATPAPPVARPGEATAGREDSPADLPSVLVREGENKAPIAEPPDEVARQEVAGQDDLDKDEQPAAEQHLQSSRRTARRWRSPQETGSPSLSEPRDTVSRRMTNSPEPNSPEPNSPEPNSPESSTEAGDTEEARLSLGQAGPTLRVEASGPKVMSVGKPANYRIRVINQGTAVAREVAVTVNIPAAVQIEATQPDQGHVSQPADASGGRRVVTWTLDRLPANSQQEWDIDLEATENQPLDLNVDWTYRPAPLSASIDVQQPQLEMSIDGPSTMRFGGTDVLKIRLSNPGNGPAENVTVNVTTTTAQEQEKRIGTLEPGESREVQLEVTAKESGPLRVDAVARADGLNVKSDHEIQVRQAVLALEVSAPEMIYAGTMAEYKIKVANHGNAVAEDVIMQIDLPTGATNGIGVDKKPIAREQPRWRVGDLDPEVERVYSLKCELNATGQNQLLARVQGTHDAGASDNGETTVEAVADLKLTVNDPKGPVRVGQDAVYEIQVLNRGSKQATQVGLVAQFSEGVEPASVAGHPADIVPGQVIFEPLESIPAGEKVTVRITARAARNGNLRFRAELTCDTPETRLVAEENTRFYGDAQSSPASRSASQSSNKPTPARR